MDKVNKETATWFNKQGEFSEQWHTLIHPDVSHWTVTTPEEAATIKASRPKLKRIQPKAHASYKDAVAFVHTNADIFCLTGATLSQSHYQLDNSSVLENDQICPSKIKSDIQPNSSCSNSHSFKPVMCSELTV